MHGMQDERDANDLPTAGGCYEYTEHEEEAIRKVITKLEDGSKVRQVPTKRTEGIFHFFRSWGAGE